MAKSNRRCALAVLPPVNLSSTAFVCDKKLFPFRTSLALGSSRSPKVNWFSDPLRYPADREASSGRHTRPSDSRRLVCRDIAEADTW
jgi:hypothetical protein